MRGTRVQQGGSLKSQDSAGKMAQHISITWGGRDSTGSKMCKQEDQSSILSNQHTQRYGRFTGKAQADLWGFQAGQGYIVIRPSKKEEMTKETT